MSAMRIVERIDNGRIILTCGHSFPEARQLLPVEVKLKESQPTWRWRLCVRCGSGHGKQRPWEARHRS